jgi:hypothetical protein
MVYHLIKDYLQDLDINSAHSKVKRTQDGHVDLEGNVAKLTLLVEALWEIVKRQNGLKDKDLLDMMHRLDLRDGKLDGKITRSDVFNCVGCGKVIQKGLPTCMYCGRIHEKTLFENK